MNYQLERPLPFPPALADNSVWYAHRPEIRSAALSYPDLARLAQTGQLHPTDLVWREGWQDWLPAHHVSGLFAPPAPAVAALVASPGPRQDETKPDLKTRAKHELHSYLIITAYVWAVLMMLRLHESMIAAQFHIDLKSHGLLIVQALVLGKVILIGEALNLGERMARALPISVTLVKSVFFAVAIIAFQALEHVVTAWWEGHPIEGGLPLELGGNLTRLATYGALLVLAFMPYFLIKEIEKKTQTKDLLLLAVGLKR